MYDGKPIIGLVGGIAAGKSHVARLFARHGVLVVSSDALVRTAYTHPHVKRAVLDMFGEDVFTPGGDVDRAAVGRQVFADAGLRGRLEKLLHPIVNDVRLRRMRAGAADPAVVAFVWDSPLLMETKLDALCDAVVFVDAPADVRATRAAGRGWDAGELGRRENLQTPLDKKRARADHVVRNDGDTPAPAGPRRPSPPGGSAPEAREIHEARADAPPANVLPAGTPLERQVADVLARVLADARQGCGGGPCGQSAAGGCACHGPA